MSKKIDNTPYLKIGFKDRQATSLAWIDFFEYCNDSNDIKSRGNVSLDRCHRIDSYCHDCKEGGIFIPSVARDFIILHKDHSTTTFKSR